MAAAAVANISPPCSSSGSQDLRRNTSPSGSRPAKKLLLVNKPAPVPRGKRERPCDACRRRKSKCVVTEPGKNCAACGVHGQECTYVEDPQPRKRRIEGEEQNADVKRRSQVSPISDISSNPSTLRSADTLKSTSNSSIVSVMPHPVDGSSSPASSRYHGLYIGPTSELEPLLLDLSTDHQASTSEEYQPRGRTPFLIDHSMLGNSIFANPDSLENVESLVGSHGSLLMTTYFKRIHPSYPVIEISSFLNYEKNNQTSIDPTVLAAIFASTLPLITEDSLSSLSPSPDVSAIEQLAFSLFADSLRAPTLATIQAGILLMQRPNIDTKTLNAQLVSAAYDLGLHVDCTSWCLSPLEQGLRRRLGWALYVQDKWCSLIHGRPSSISSDNWTVTPLLDSDFEFAPIASTTETYRGCEFFKHLVSLTSILCLVLEQFYTLCATQDVSLAGPAAGTQLILSRAKPVQIQLKAWFAALPACLKSEATPSSSPTAASHSTSTSSPIPPCSASLHLAYFATEITLHRCIIRSLYPVSISSSPSIKSSSPPSLTHLLRSAAKTRLISTLDFIHRLRPSQLQNLSQLPFAPFSRPCFALVGAFGGLLRATSEGRPEDAFYQARLSELMWTVGCNVRSGTGWLAEVLGGLEKVERSCGRLGGKKEILGSRNPDDVAGERHRRDGHGRAGIERDVQAVRFAQIGRRDNHGEADEEGETEIASGLASPSLSLESIEGIQG